MTSAASERAAALAALAIGVTPDGEAAAAPALVRTGRTVEAGGEEARLLIRRASSLGYMTPNGRQTIKAVPGDVVLLTKHEANRLDKLGVTVAADSDLGEVEDEVEGTGYTDEQLATMGAADLIAFVGQHPDQRARVRELELAKKESKQRSTVLDATEPTPEHDADAEAEHAAHQDDDEGAAPAGEAEDGSTAEDRGES